MITFNKLSCHVKSHRKVLEFEVTIADRQGLHNGRQAPLPAMKMLYPGEEAKLAEEHTSASDITLGEYQETSSSEFER